ncbi:hypothetical protein D210916BOD24_03800 [Alteromonas sp. D210916BOD_24]|uniref:hypothetical protein n=1 Tax=Alteromonas sp. D210916BOD_24 TaxID=3157618 RepID=UPI00399CD026
MLILLRFLPAWAVGFVLASLAHSHSVLWGLNDLGITITFGDWLFMIIQDAKGLLPTYGSVIAMALGLSFALVHLFFYIQQKHGITAIKRRISGLLFPLAGGLAFFVMLMAMQPILDVTLIAGARTTTGFITQCLSGAVAGWVYAKLQPTYHSNL